MYIYVKPIQEKATENSVSLERMQCRKTRRGDAT
ncbi:hypothetical protein OOU_Y34scaffold00434g2 [Pyricularia oryzae Y34]|uniref:Uncharacterized protein n=2 Tax=Pyricularia oryzae TaxID=318829 RepID=A0AA97P206_PYRO3|nr:hypothetical protein OOU_Y34scaffold00434g2 [Pyricularia oryzae Y34]